MASAASKPLLPCGKAAAAHNVALVLREHRRTFWAERATEHAVVAFMVRANVTIRSVIDIGAADYTYKRGDKADDTGMTRTFQLLGDMAHYYGFEPGPQDFRALRRKARRNRSLPPGHVHLYPLAVAGSSGSKRVFGEASWKRMRNGSQLLGWRPHWDMSSSPNTRTTNALLEGLHQYRHVGDVQATTLDAFAQKERLQTLDFVKVDTEGTEREVLLEGAAQLLKAKRVRTVLWEYGDKMSADTFQAAKNRSFVPPPSPDLMHGPTLKRLSAALLAYGYHSYFAGVTWAGRAVFVPLHEEYWDDGFEVCRLPKSGICWHNIVSTLAGSPEEYAIRARPAPPTWAHTVATCLRPQSAQERPMLHGGERHPDAPGQPLAL